MSLQPSEGAGISLQAEVTVQGLIPASNAELVKRFPNGDILIGGGEINPWAARLDAGGNLIWTWNAPPVVGATRQDHSKFVDAAILAGGQILLCGTHVGDRQIRAFITILDERGRFIDSRVFEPPPGGAWNTEALSCTALSRGVALVLNSLGPFTGWLKVLDDTGSERWQKLSEPYSGWVQGITELEDHSIIALKITATFDGSVPKATLERFDVHGEELTSRKIRGEYASLLQGDTGNAVSVLTYLKHSSYEVATFGHEMKDEGSLRQVNIELESRAPLGSRLSDGGFALFGTGADLKAIVVRLDPDLKVLPQLGVTRWGCPAIRPCKGTRSLAVEGRAGSGLQASHGAEGGRNGG